MRRAETLGSGMLLLAALIWGMAFAFQRTGMESVGPLTFTAARMGLGTLAAGVPALFLTLKEKPSRKQLRDTLKGGFFCGLFLAVSCLLQQAGMVYTPAGKAGFLSALYLLLVPVIGRIFLKKPCPGRVWAAVVLGVFGMYLLCMAGAEPFSRGDVLLLLCALGYSFQILCCDHYAGRGNPLAISAVEFATVTVISSILAVLFEEPAWSGIAAARVPILYCGILSGGVGYTLQLAGQRITKPAAASLLMSLESVFAVLGGVLLLGERMTAQESMGCLVMFAAVLLVELPGRKHVEKENNNGSCREAGQPG